MNLDLNEIEERLDAKKLQSYYGCNSTYAVKILRRSTIPEDLKDTPLYEVPNLSEHGIEIDFELQHEDRYCFGTYLRSNKSSRVFRHLVNVYINHKDKKNENLNNYLWMSKEQLEEHIDYLRSHLGFDFFFRIVDAGDWYIVQYDFKDTPRLQIKYALFWTRYSYEFPSSMCMIDAYILKDRHPEEALHNLLRIPQRFMVYSRQCVRDDQSISVNGLFLSDKQLKSRLQRTNLSVCGIYETQAQTTCIYNVDDPFHWIDTGLKNYLPCLVEKNYIKFSAWLHNNNRFEAYEKMLKWYKEHPFKDKIKEKVDSE